MPYLLHPRILVGPEIQGLTGGAIDIDKSTSRYWLDQTSWLLVGSNPLLAMHKQIYITNTGHQGQNNTHPGLLLVTPSHSGIKKERTHPVQAVQECPNLVRAIQRNGTRGISIFWLSLLCLFCLLNAFHNIPSVHSKSNGVIGTARTGSTILLLFFHPTSFFLLTARLVVTYRYTSSY